MMDMVFSFFKKLPFAPTIKTTYVELSTNQPTKPNLRKPQRGMEIKTKNKINSKTIRNKVTNALQYWNKNENSVDTAKVAGGLLPSQNGRVQMVNEKSEGPRIRVYSWSTKSIVAAVLRTFPTMDDPRTWISIEECMTNDLTIELTLDVFTFVLRIQFDICLNGSLCIKWHR